MLLSKVMGIKELTVFALSTDNLKRSKVEVDVLMSLFRDTLWEMCDVGGFMQVNNIKARILGDMSFLPEDVSTSLMRSQEHTKDNTSLTVNVCVCYNSKFEILEAVDKVSDLYAEGQLPSQLKRKAQKLKIASGAKNENELNL